MKKKTNSLGVGAVTIATLFHLASCTDNTAETADTSSSSGQPTTTATASSSVTRGTATTGSSSGTDPLAESSSTGDNGSSTAGSTTTGTTDCKLDRIELASARSGMHPEGIAYDAAGTRLFVGGFIAEGVVEVDPCSGEVESFADPALVGNAAGLLVDESLDALWVCGVDFGQMPSNARVTALALDDGAVIGTHFFPPGSGICNDLTLDGAGNLFLTDSFANRIVRLPAEDKNLPGDHADTVEVWSADPAFGQIMPGTFGLNGIAWDGGSSLLVVGFQGTINDTDPEVRNPSHLYRVPISGDGGAGAAEVLGDIAAGDGLEWLEGNTFVVNEQTTTVSVLSLEDGVSTEPLATGLDFSTTSVVVGTDVWVVEGQLDHFLDPKLGPATEPFAIRRFPLP